ADIIDINMGCPVPKILKAKSGGYLLQDEAKIEKIITGLSSVLKKPVTVKTRIGWDSNNINILNIAKIAEGSGASAISIHGRTVKQGFSGDVDYELIKKVKEKVKIPVIVSGDIDSPLKAKEILDYTGCDGIMIGRAVKGRLWLMMDMLIFIIGNGGRVIDPEFNPGIDWKKEFSKIYLKFLINFKGENKAVREFRKHLCWIFKGSGGISRARSEFFKIESFKDAVNCINNI
ncbi:MAG: tRNA-dihydrouridine synthase, partial [Actinobacteria bacterium]|nr:tRNA-dihydrouridine synthase [Actinomycetota bacterium]